MQIPRLLRSTPVLIIALLALGGCRGGGDGGGQSTAAQPSGARSGAASNGAPTIRGQPGSSVLADRDFVFQPTASDPDGDPLTFSATNLPQWLTLDATTGALRGRPSAADLGTYAGISIVVSDGRRSATLGPFSITVAASGSGSARLSWTPPTENLDGSALTDLAGYVIQYGNSPDALAQSVSISNPSISTYQVDNLTSGTWYFAVQAVNSRGATSPMSEVAWKTIG